MMTATIYNESTGEARTIPHVQADHLVRNSRGEWSFAKPLPAGLEPRSAALSHLNGPGAVTVRAPSAGTAVHVLDRREHVAVRRAPDRRRRGARDHPLAACEHDPAERERAADPRILQVASEVADAAIPVARRPAIPRRRPFGSGSTGAFGWPPPRARGPVADPRHCSVMHDRGNSVRPLCSRLRRACRRVARTFGANGNCAARVGSA